jgi:hypothetical protein
LSNESETDLAVIRMRQSDFFSTEALS